MTRAEFEDQLFERARRVLGRFMDIPPRLEDELAGWEPDDVLSADEQWDIFRIFSPHFVGCGPDDELSNAFLCVWAASGPEEEFHWDELGQVPDILRASNYSTGTIDLATDVKEAFTVEHSQDPPVQGMAFYTDHHGWVWAYPDRHHTFKTPLDLLDFLATYNRD